MSVGSAQTSPEPAGQTQFASVRQLRAEFGALSKQERPSTVALAFLHLGRHAGFAIAVALASHYMFLWSFIGGIGFYVVCLFLIGSRFRAVINMVHECSHGILVRSPRGNILFGHFLAFFDFTAFDDYTREHLTHHRFLGHPTKDLDYAARRHLFGTNDGSFLVRHILRPLTLFCVPSYIQPIIFRRSDSLPLALARASFILGLLALAQFVIGWTAFVLYYLLPYATAYQVIRYWSDALDHADLLSSNDEFLRTRNHIHRWSLVNWFLFPRDDQYHLVHHLFPKAPTRSHARLHSALLSSPAYAGRDHSLEGVVRSRRSSNGVQSEQGRGRDR
jgi:fatty acid desaturase